MLIHLLPASFIFMSFNAGRYQFQPFCRSAVVQWLVFLPVTRKTRVQFPAAEFALRVCFLTQLQPIGAQLLVRIVQEGTPGFEPGTC